MTSTESSPTDAGGETSGNTYVLLDHFNRAIDVMADADYGWGRDYHLKMLRHVEALGLFSGITFFIAYHPPKALPECGPHVVLVLIGDEFHLPRAYFSKIAAVLRCYGTGPSYVDGWPVTRLRLAAALQHVHKQLVRLKALVAEIRSTGWSGVSRSGGRTLQLPLGYFRDFAVTVKPMAERTLDHSFMGSLGSDFAALPLRQKILDGPKYLSRRRMLDMLERHGKGFHGARTVTSNFDSSIQNHAAYVTMLAETRIMLAPRGVSHETYRFYEALKAGCVVICEPQPRTWYNHDHPGIVLRDWSQLPKRLEALLADPERLEALSQSAQTYWRERLSEEAVAQAVAKFLMARLDKAYRCPTSPAYWRTA